MNPSPATADESRQWALTAASASGDASALALVYVGDRLVEVRDAIRGGETHPKDPEMPVAEPRVEAENPFAALAEPSPWARALVPDGPVGDGAEGTWSVAIVARDSSGDDRDGLPVGQPPHAGLRGARDAIDALGQCTSAQAEAWLAERGVRTRRAALETLFTRLAAEPWRIAVVDHLELRAGAGRRARVWRRRRDDDPDDPLANAGHVVGWIRGEIIKLLADGPMRAVTIRERLGISKSTCSAAVDRSCADGQMKVVPRGKERWYALPDWEEPTPEPAPEPAPDPELAAPAPTARTLGRPAAAPVDPEADAARVKAAGDQYEAHDADALLDMCRARGIDVDEVEVLLLADPAAHLRGVLRAHAAELKAQTPVSRSDGGVARLAVKRKLSDEDQRQQKIEQDVLREVLEAPGPVRPRAVAAAILRNQAEIRAVMLDLVHRGLLVSNDGYTTFTTIASEP